MALTQTRMIALAEAGHNYQLAFEQLLDYCIETLNPNRYDQPPNLLSLQSLVNTYGRQIEPRPINAATIAKERQHFKDTQTSNIYAMKYMRRRRGKDPEAEPKLKPKSPRPLTAQVADDKGFDPNVKPASLTEAEWLLYKQQARQTQQQEQLAALKREGAKTMPPYDADGNPIK